MGRRLEEYGDVLTDRDLGELLQRGPRYMERLHARERRTGVRCTPIAIPGLGYRYTKDAVRRWLQTGTAPGPARLSSAPREEGLRC